MKKKKQKRVEKLFVDVENIMEDLEFAEQQLAAIPGRIKMLKAQLADSLGELRRELNSRD